MIRGLWLRMHPARSASHGDIEQVETGYISNEAPKMEDMPDMPVAVDTVPLCAPAISGSDWASNCGGNNSTDSRSAG